MSYLRLAFCLFIGLSSFSTYSGSMGEEKHSFDIYVPNLERSNELSGGAFFLKPTGAVDYNVYTAPLNPTVATPLFSPDWYVQTVPSTFTPGFYFNYRHVFENSGNDVNLYWAHLRTSNSTSNGAAEHHFNGPLYQVGPEARAINFASAQNKYAYDIVNLEVAKNIYIDPSLQTRLLFGISGLFLNQELNSTFSGTPNFSITSKEESRFDGAGIRFGLDGSYVVRPQLSVVGLFASSLFLGTGQPSITYTGVSDVLRISGIPVNNQNIYNKNYLQLVPAVDGKLGIKYFKPLESNRRFAVEAGYMGAYYFNVFQGVTPSNYADNSPGIDTGVIYLKSLIKVVKSFGLTGPYVTASLKV